MTNCIFLCVFHQEKYVDMLFLLLESLYIYGGVGVKDDTILIYTSTAFQKRIQASHLYRPDLMVFQINDTYHDVDSACKARLDWFQWGRDLTETYDKVLYLDTDILIQGDVQSVFDVCQDPLLYALEEGQIDWEFQNVDFWGKTLFSQEELDSYPDKTAFSSGILLFRPCTEIQTLFEAIRRDMSQRTHCFIDQGFIVYNAFKSHLYNNKAMKSVAAINLYERKNDVVLYHFSGGPGSYDHKIDKMRAFLNRSNDQQILTYIAQAKDYITESLMPLIHECGEPLEGNIFMLHNQTQFTNVFLDKQKNISLLVLDQTLQSGLEIGFNAGFSALLMLLSNPRLHISCFDLAEHAYTRPCFQKLKEQFGDRIELTMGDSTKTLPKVTGVYDVIHIDGGHDPAVATSDVVNAYRLSQPGKTIQIFDDYDFHDLKQVWDRFCHLYRLKPLDIHVYPSPHHNVKFVPA